MSTPITPRLGRPPKVDADGVSTRERLLRSAVEAYTEFGYDGVTLAEIARRAEVSTPAIYNHFDNRSELLVEASRAAVHGFLPGGGDGSMDLPAAVEQWTHEASRNGRRMLAELHLVSLRNDEIRQTLGAWHTERFESVVAAGDQPAKVKASYVLLLGLTLLDSIDDIEVDQDDLLVEIHRMVDAIMPLND